MALFLLILKTSMFMSALLSI